MLGGREEALRFNHFAGALARNIGYDANGDTAAIEGDPIGERQRFRLFFIEAFTCLSLRAHDFRRVPEELFKRL
jgi:hypothetical protein